MIACKLYVSSLPFLLALTITLTACSHQSANTDKAYDLPEILQSGELRVITSKSAISYFINDQEEMGYEYDLIQNYADYIGMDVKLIVAADNKEMKQLLLENKGDIIAFQFPCSKTNKKDLAFTDCRSYSFPVLIQSSSAKSINNVTELIGDTVCITPNDKHWKRLKNLNEEVGGGINIKIMSDTLSSDDLIFMVSNKEIPMTVADNDIAEVFKNNLHNINTSVQLGLVRERGWAVRKTSPLLFNSVNQWFMETKNSRFYTRLHAKYYGGKLLDKSIVHSIPKGNISPYDDLFKKYAPEIHWDWRLLAALSFNESHFDVNAISSAGALGLMQMMPGTGAKYGLDSVSIFEAEPAIAASIQYIKSLGLIYREVQNNEERLKFILASYNAGPAHVLDARALAKKYGSDPNVWQNVEKYLLLKSNPEFYNDEVCKFGYFRGNHTVRYIKDVFDTYHNYLGIKQTKTKQK